MPEKMSPPFEAPLRALIHLIHTGTEFDILKYEEGEVLVSATHSSKCDNTVGGYHTHYLVGLVANP